MESIQGNLFSWVVLTDDLRPHLRMDNGAQPLLPWLRNSEPTGTTRFGEFLKRGAQSLGHFHLDELSDRRVLYSDTAWGKCDSKISLPLLSLFSLSPFLSLTTLSIPPPRGSCVPMAPFPHPSGGNILIILTAVRYREPSYWYLCFW